MNHPFVFSFEYYDPDHGSPSRDDVLWELPLEIQYRLVEIITRAGFDPVHPPRCRLLTRAWGHHLARSIIVARDVNFIPGQTFAVSTQSVP
jgi:hypothetical protein